MKKIEFGKVELNLKSVVVSLSLLAIVGVGTLAWQQVQASYTNSVDYTVVVRTKPYVRIKTDIDKSFAVRRVKLFYRLSQEPTWHSIVMDKQVHINLNYNSYIASIPAGMSIDDEVQYYIEITNKDQSTTRPTNAPNSYLNLTEHLITIQ